ncbi:unnamed protein product [Linum trigynum]|uniref:Uncharacterized protein n=1 Tax=Linum trigynum TaxID=586398 RepID=A0AAV2GEW2_9ROSI
MGAITVMRSIPINTFFRLKHPQGLVFPACFDRTRRCPNENVRRIRVSASYEDPTWKGANRWEHMIYSNRSDRSFYKLNVAFALQDLSDEEILLQCSTSPSAEGPDFVNNMKR